ncbi:MAG: 8-oxo-dGTP pyrophosphatase MutT (NUDIX family) [Paracoccaceae bacterium]|jgi:8-oxo-dGTP pyrophosphatase MutT (NUDIX family)
MDKSEIRNAATVILLRDKATDPKILMGQRGKNAAFMPNKFVFPGGALDKTDADVPLATALSEQCMAHLQKQSDPDLAVPLVLAAIREVWEETGLLLGEASATARDQAGNVPPDWRTFFEHGVLPSGAGMKFVFRAITPPGRPRRFDARFFVVDTDRVASDLDDFDQACDELSHLQWISLKDARNLDMPFITEVVLAEIEADLREPDRSARVPFFFNADGQSNFLRL